ncbi:MAG: GMC family oxidoreductase [Alphaproteobacteria bacterium]|nr:GMC family oxidoreductase [Alphaproteobacteria bacterium]
MAAVTFDHDDDTVVVIIGSGAGGGTLADELTAKGVNCVLLEAGPRIENSEFQNDEHWANDTLLWENAREGSGDRPTVGIPTWMVKAVGGCTIHWVSNSPRFQPHEFKTRTTYGAIGGANVLDWPLCYADMDPFYSRAEYKMGVAMTHGLPPMRPTNLSKIMIAGARRLGYTKVHAGRVAINQTPRDGRNACDEIGFCQQGCRSGAKWSTLYSEIPRAEATGRLELRTNCMALQIHHDAAGRASGVLYADKAGAQHFQKARIVCVACNTIQTTRLLLNSASARFPDGLANSSGALGRHYMTHTEGGVIGVFDRSVNWHRGRVGAGTVEDEAPNDPRRGFIGGYYMLAFFTGLPAYAGSLTPGAWGRSYAGWLERYAYTAGMYIVGEDLAQPGNRVTLHATKKDQYGLPIPCFVLNDHPNDMALRQHALKRATALWEAIGARRTREWLSIPNGHNLGTCRMSEKPADGVVNTWGRTHDLPNVFISDGSQFTSSAACNPTLTIVALAIRQAGYIAEAMRRNDI